MPVWPTFDFRFWGQIIPKVKIFQNVFPNSSTGHRCTFHDQIWWKLAVAKLPKGPLDHHAKNSRSAGLVPDPILPKMGQSRPKFPERCHPLTCPPIPNLVRIGCVFLDLIEKDWFFGPRSQYNRAVSLQRYGACSNENSKYSQILDAPTSFCADTKVRWTMTSKETMNTATKTERVVIFIVTFPEYCRRNYSRWYCNARFQQRLDD